MKKIGFIAMMLVSITLSACITERQKADNGVVVSRNIAIKDFEEIAIEGSMDVHFTQDNKTSVKVKGNENALKQIEIKSDGKLLTIRSMSGKWNFFSKNNDTGDIEIYVSSPNLRGIAIAGSGEFVAKGMVDTDTLNISIAGSGDIALGNLICNMFSASISGSGDIDIDKVNAADATLSIAGSGSLDIDNANIGYVESSIAGSGSIDVKGNVKKHKEDIAGSGSIDFN